MRLTEKQAQRFAKGCGVKDMRDKKLDEVIIKGWKMQMDRKRDLLMREIKQEKSSEYKMGYFDGILDMYNQAVRP